VDDSDILTAHREQLIVSVCAHREQPEFQLLNISPWLAMSPLQNILLPIIVILAPKRLWTIPISGLVISVPNADRCRT